MMVMMPDAIQEQFSLNRYTEYVGYLAGIKIQDSHVTVTLSHKNLKLTFQTDSMEGQAVIRKLANVPSGCKVGLLRTGDFRCPLLIRRLEADE